MKLKPVQSKYLISIHQPRLWLAALSSILLIVLGITWFAFEYGKHIAGFDQADYDQEIEVLRQALDQQTSEKEKALRENARLSRGSDIDKNASSKMNDSLAACEDEMLKVKEELTFYQNLVAPRKSAREIQVNKVVITPGNKGVYTYKVVLIQVGRHDLVQRGTVELSFEGKNASGEQVRLDLPTVSTQKASKKQRFGFKYFQNFEGGIRFPEGFTPLSMFVKALPTSSKVPRIEQVYHWDKLIAGGNEANVGQEKVN